MSEATRVGELAWNPSGEERQLLADVVDRGALPSYVTAVDATSAVLCVLAQRLSAGEATRLLDELPSGMGGLLAPCALHGERPPEIFDRAGFVHRIKDHLKVSPREAEDVMSAVFAAVRARLSDDEIRHVASQLPADLEELWLPPSLH